MQEESAIINTPLGKLEVRATNRAVTHVGFSGNNVRNSRHVKSNPIIEKAIHQLEEYFSGCRRDFDLPLDPQGTAFQKKVWAALRKIPYGKTFSYGDIARKIGKDFAFRAVGGANNKNPIAVIVPCHRVIGANGKMVGYGGGLDKKCWLLRHEGVR